MDYANLLFGIFALCIGLISIYFRVFKNSKGFGKLDAMKERFGDRAGTVIHVLAYTVVPLLVGVIFITRSFL